jgi:hypothetical protein
MRTAAARRPLRVAFRTGLHGRDSDLDARRRSGFLAGLAVQLNNPAKMPAPTDGPRVAEGILRKR